MTLMPDWILERGSPVGREDHPLKDLIAELLEELGDDDRRALEMYFYEGLTHAAIAREFGLRGKQSGQYRVRRALRHLQAKLAERGING